MYSKKAVLRRTQWRVLSGVCFAVDNDDEDPDKKEFIAFTGEGLKTPTLKGGVLSLEEGQCSTPD